jgi:signal transduction histidine kinase/ligand-binding sensor domain-containing protein
MATTRTRFGILRTACLLTALQVVSPAKAQYRLDAWTADNGLPQNIIVGICQTPDGYLWVATLDGLARFDGVRFTVFDKNNSPGIESNRFTSLYERNGDLWLSTEGSGVTRYHGGTFTTYTTQDGLLYNSVRAVTGDGSGNLWVLANDTITQWQEAVGRFIDVTPKGLKVPLDTFLWEGGGFWGADETRLYCFVEGRVITYELPRWLPGRSIRFVTRDQDGTIWLETNSGIRARIVDGNVRREPAEVLTTYSDRRGTRWEIGIGHRLVRYVSYSANGDEKKISKISFNSLAEDREGNLWLGTGAEGLYRVRKQFITVISKQQGLIDRDVYPVFQDRRGAVWIGAWNGGVSRLEGGRCVGYTKRDGLASNLPTAFEEDRDGRLWVATHGGARIFRDGQFRPAPGLMIPEHATVQAIHQGGKGALWFGTSRGLVRYKDGASQLFTAKDGLAADDVRVIVDGSKGEMWIGGYGGLTRLRDGSFAHWTERDGLPSNTVRAIYYDSDGIVWIGTYDGGLGRFQNGKFTRYTTREGLFNNGVFQILEDGRGNLWMSCNRGIYRVSKRELSEFAASKQAEITSVNYGRSDGMFNVECNGGYWPAGIKARDGKLWFPTQDGVAVIDPLAAPTNSQPPPVAIESLLLDHVPTPFDRPVRITPDKTSFEIQYTALSFIDSQQIRFEYRLEGLDSSWVDAGPQRTAYYSHVPPGQYVFTVIARNSDGVWNKAGATVSFVILPVFYQTRWFELLCLLAAAGILWLLYAMRLRQVASHLQARLEERLEERERIARDLHDTLLQGIHSASMQLYVADQRLPEDSPAKPLVQRVVRLMTEVSEEGRNALRSLRPSHPESDALEDALSRVLEEVNTQEHIDFRVTAEGAAQLLHPIIRDEVYRIGREALLNAFRHSGAKRIEVEVEYSRDLRLRVRDDGCGIDAQTLRTGREGHWGLATMRERAEKIGARFEVLSRADAGTEVEISIPGKVAFESTPSNRFSTWLLRLFPMRSGSDVHPPDRSRPDER